jgi:hypothetical protein
MFLHWADFFCLLLLRHNLRIVLGPLIKVATIKINFKLEQKVDPLLLHHLLISFSSYQIWGDTNLCQTRPVLILLLTKNLNQDMHTLWLRFFSSSSSFFTFLRIFDNESFVIVFYSFGVNPRFFMLSYSTKPPSACYTIECI